MATVEIPDKICPHCGGSSWRTEKYNTLKKGVVIRYRCAQEHRERTKRYYNSHIDDIKIYSSERIHDGINKTPKMREYYRKRSKQEIQTLSDNYVKKMIAHGIKRSDGICVKQKELSSELVLMKRQELSLKRQIMYENKNMQ